MQPGRTYRIRPSIALALMVSAGFLLTASTRQLAPEETPPRGRIDAISSGTRLAHLPAEITNISTFQVLRMEEGSQDRGIVSYKVSKPTRVRIRIVRRGDRDLVYRTLIDWSDRAAGLNVEAWDGRDQSGHWLEGALCLFVFETIDGAHWDHGQGTCGEIALTLHAPAEGETIRGERPSFRASWKVPDASPSRSVNLRLYVDGAPAGKWESASSNEILTWDAAAAGPGSHRFTLVADDGEDHVGTVTRIVHVVGLEG